MRKFLTKDEQKKVYRDTIDGVINAENSSDLKVLLDIVKSIKWTDARDIFLMGLLQGALMQYKKDVSVEELESIFRGM
jgi:hypothetical protein